MVWFFECFLTKHSNDQIKLIHLFGQSSIKTHSAMNLVSSSNGDLTSAAIGLAVAGVFSLFEDTPKKENTIINEYSGVFASIRVIDKIKNTDNVKLYDTYINNDMFDTRNNLFKKIHETINIDPNSKKYNINWYNNFRLYKEILNYFYYF